MTDVSVPLKNPFALDENITYEETPVIEPIVSAPPQPPPPPPPVSPPSPAPQSNFNDEDSSPRSSIVIFTIFIILFFIGLGVSFFFRDLIPWNFFEPKQQAIEVTPTPTVTPIPDPYAGWKTYFVISGISRNAIEGVRFKLPPEIVELFCDGVSCGSQGAYLPGGTRFTVAARGSGQVLTDYRGKIITDYGGRKFTTAPTTVSDREAVEFTGNFTGTTVTGYTFTQMRGVMVAVTGKLALEVNHFTPAGVTADFTSDDALFNKILSTFEFIGLPTPSVAPTVPELIPTSIPLDTSSGS